MRASSDVGDDSRRVTDSPNPPSTASILNSIRHNWSSGLTVALVSVPLSVSLAVAAGATPVMGVITAIWAGLAAAIFGGCAFNVVGPTGALSGILATYAIAYGVGILPVLAVGSGVVILTFALFRLGKYILLIPSSVVHGFTLGVALIIGLNQLNFALGLTGLEQHEQFIRNVWASVTHSREAELVSVAVFAVSLGFLFAMARRFPRLPGSIVIAAVGIFLGAASARGLIPLHVPTLNERFADLSPRLFQAPTITTGFLDVAFISPILSVSVIAMIETLVSAKIADGMTKTRTQTRRELFGLGLANVASGMAGGIPATAALARTSLNIRSGATGRASTVINGVGVGMIAFLLLPSFRHLPLPVVAAILVFVAARMVEAKHFAHLYRCDKRAFWMAINVAAITIIEDPIVGISVGAAISLLFFVNELSKSRSEVSISQGDQGVAWFSGARTSAIHGVGGDTLVYRFIGELTYINAQSHIDTLTGLHRSVRTVVLHFRNLFYMDVDGLTAIEEIIETLESKGIAVYITTVNEYTRSHFRRMKWFLRMEDAGRVFAHTNLALNDLGLPAPDGGSAPARGTAS